MMNWMPKQEKRNLFMNSEFETRDNETSGKVISGYFIKFDVKTELFPGYFEMIRKESVSLDRDIRALFNHDTSMILGRTGNKTLELFVDEVGVRGNIYINEQDPFAVGAHARVARGDVVGSSFGFYPTKISTVDNMDGTYTDIIEKMELFEISPCTFPAYEQTEIKAREQNIEKFKKEKLEKRKKEIKERYTHARTN